MLSFTGRRTAVLSSILCTGLVTSAFLAVQANATSDAASRPAATAPTTAAPRPLVPRAAAIPAGAPATNAHCGQTITASLTLDGDLRCSGAGLIVSGTSVVLNLNGHEIVNTSASNAYGIQVIGTSATVENGLVTAFFTGVRVSGTTDTISNLRTTDDRLEGIFSTGPGVKIVNCVAADIRYLGIDSQGAGGVLTGNHELSTTEGPGLFVAGHGQSVTGNVANGNSTYGIEDQGFGTTLGKNTANFNQQDGILIDEGGAIDGGGNTAKGNDYASGALPAQCRGIVCS